VPDWPVASQFKCIVSGARAARHRQSDNARVAQEKSIALCQDTGIAEVFVNLGQNVHIDGESLQDAVNKGVARFRQTY